jgi:hypothetical protein
LGYDGRLVVRSQLSFVRSVLGALFFVLCFSNIAFNVLKSSDRRTKYQAQSTKHRTNN